MGDLVVLLAVAAVAGLIGLVVGILIARVLTRRMDEPEEDAGS